MSILQNKAFDTPANVAFVRSQRRLNSPIKSQQRRTMNVLSPSFILHFFPFVFLTLLRSLYLGKTIALLRLLTRLLISPFPDFELAFLESTSIAIIEY